MRLSSLPRIGSLTGVGSRKMTQSAVPGPVQDNIFRDAYLSFRVTGKTLPATPSKWKTTEPVRMSRQSFLDVLQGRTPVIREPGYLTRELCSRYEGELNPRLSPYTHVAGPDMFRVGVAQFEFQAQAADDFTNRSDEKERYFKEAKKVMGIHQELSRQTGSGDVWARVLNDIAALVPEFDVVVANEGPGKTYFSGIYRAINESTPIHCDWSPYDSLTEEWILNKVTHQAVFNLYLTPVREGRTVVHDIQWTEDALEFRDPNSYGYSPDLVLGRQNCVIRPQAGDLCFFNSRNMHQVFPVGVEPHPVLGAEVQWCRPRLTLSSFMGLLPPKNEGERQKLIFWS